MTTFSVRGIAGYSEAENRAGWSQVWLDASPWRWRFCSTDRCGVCGAGPGEVCRSCTDLDSSRYEFDEPLPYFHMQKKTGREFDNSSGIQFSHKDWNHG